MLIDFKQLSPNQCYFAMVQTIVPRPIAWVLSDNGEASKDPYNLAPYSFFTGICSSPPLLMLSMGKKSAGDEKGQKKTLEKILNYVNTLLCISPPQHFWAR